MESTQLEPLEWHEITLRDGEDLKGEILAWAVENNIEYAWFQLVGEIKGERFASGYQNNQPDSEKIMVPFRKNAHALATGTISRDENDEVHLHGPVGREGETVTGCWADNPTVFRGLSGLVTVFRKTS